MDVMDVRIFRAPQGDRVSLPNRLGLVFGWIVRAVVRCGEYENIRVRTGILAGRGVVG